MDHTAPLFECCSSAAASAAPAASAGSTALPQAWSGPYATNRGIAPPAAPHA
ncbi:uncharacterized protein ASCRUDRAFT_82563 [Ascoidea rubescens DSM 1968]|uniref:Uncharacterized protein n=1 Tax=Ascoidea rubescens DSM 1968 TaxID=1344418 RepID=A0A1D2VAE7_9ASCO|nr:hypothetical protein ASCRUDRAFT_82563 [Ascoidea rubescens DSM 1968]ODV58638.1 hypothetical protein ASCRUDRAFT_82563 [Ascoidea rubescens DSM 1968]